jgi:hypothetical protein
MSRGARVRSNPTDGLTLVAMVMGGMWLLSQVRQAVPDPGQLGQGAGGAIASTGQGVGGAVGSFGQGVGGALGATGSGIGGALGSFFNGLGTAVGSVVNPSGTAVRQLYQVHDDGQCWFDTQFADGHWTFQGPVGRGNCGA